MHERIAGTKNLAAIEVYPEVRHGFAFHTRRTVHHEAAAERHRVWLLDLFLRTL